MVKKLIDSYEAALDLLREERYEGARRLEEIDVQTAPLPDSLEEILAVMKPPRRPRFSGIAGGEKKKR